MLEHFVVLRKMDIDQRLGERHEMILLQHIRANRIGYAEFEVRHQLGDDGPHGLGVHPHFLHLLGRVVVGFEALGHLGRDLVPRREFGVDEVIGMIESAGFAEEQVLDVALQFDVLRALKPDQFALVGGVKEGGTEPLGAPDTDRMPFGDFTDDLDVRILVIQLGDAVEAAAVDILIRELAQHIQRRTDVELSTKNVGTFGTDILAISYISLRKFH